MNFYKATPEICQQVADIATKWHERLNGRSVAVIMQETATKRRGKAILGTCCRPPPKMLPLLEAGVEFVICLPLDMWTVLTPEQRTAVIDHELCHCGISAENGEPYIKAHDYEEFADIAIRHGAWRDDPAENAVQAALKLEAQGVTVSTIKGGKAA